MVFKFMLPNSLETAHVEKHSLLVSHNQNLDAEDPLVAAYMGSDNQYNSGLPALTVNEAKEKAAKVMAKLKKLVPKGGTFVRYFVPKTPFLGVQPDAQGVYIPQEFVYDTFILYTHEDFTQPNEIWDVGKTATKFSGITSEDEAFLGEILTPV